MATETSESTTVVYLIGFVFHDIISLLVSASQPHLSIVTWQQILSFNGGLPYRRHKSGVIMCSVNFSIRPSEIVARLQ